MDDLRQGRDRIRSDINVAPLVDVCMVLLIIFIVVTPLLGHRQDIELPRGRTPGNEPDKSGTATVSLTFGPPPEIYVSEENVPLSLAALRSRMTDLAATSPETRLVVRADRRIPYREVKRVLGTLAKSGFSGAGLIAERDTRPR